MMVVDASALVGVLAFDEENVRQAAQRISQAGWMCAPDLIDYEVLDALRKMVRRGEIDGATAEHARQTVRDLRLRRYPLTDEMTERMWELRHSVSAYDASYVALAESLGFPLVTTDGKLAAGLKALTSIEVECYPVSAN